MQALVTPLAVVMLAGTGMQVPAAATVVARAGPLVVTTDELRDVVREARQSGDPARMVDTLTIEGLERMSLALIEQKRLAQEARARGLEASPDVSRAIERAVTAILTARLLDREAAALDSSDAALQRYYETHEAVFRTGPRRKAHHIVVATKEELDAALADLTAGRPFEEVAAARNTDATKAVRGDLGWIPRGIMVRTFEDALFAIDRPGAMSGVVRTNFGFHLIRLDEVDPGCLLPFDQIRDQVRQAMVDAAVADLKARLASRSPATIDRDALAALVPGKKR